MAKPNLIFYLPFAKNIIKGKILKTSIALFFVLILSTAFASPTYYPTDLTAKVQVHALKDDALNQDCGIAKYGSPVVGGNDGFEPPLTQKGNTARAIFYFSVRYKISIPKAEEDVLRRWNELDPVDQQEMDQNDAIQAVQGNRNPFIDFPTLANDISKF